MVGDVVHDNAEAIDIDICCIREHGIQLLCHRLQRGIEAHRDFLEEWDARSIGALLNVELRWDATQWPQRWYRELSGTHPIQFLQIPKEKNATNINCWWKLKETYGEMRSKDGMCLWSKTKTECGYSNMVKPLRSNMYVSLIKQRQNVGIPIWWDERDQRCMCLWSNKIKNKLWIPTYSELDFVLGNEDGLPLGQGVLLVGPCSGHEIVVNVVISSKCKRKQSPWNKLLHSRSPYEARYLLLVFIEHFKLLFYSEDLHLQKSKFEVIVTAD